MIRTCMCRYNIYSSLPRILYIHLNLSQLVTNYPTNSSYWLIYRYFGQSMIHLMTFALAPWKVHVHILIQILQKIWWYLVMFIFMHLILNNLQFHAWNSFNDFGYANSPFKILHTCIALSWSWWYGMILWTIDAAPCCGQIFSFRILP